MLIHCKYITVRTETEILAILFPLSIRHSNIHLDTGKTVSAGCVFIDTFKHAVEVYGGSLSLRLLSDREDKEIIKRVYFTSTMLTEL